MFRPDSFRTINANRRIALGSDNPLFAQSLNRLASVHEQLGSYAAAEPLCERSLVILEKSLARDYPTLIEALHNYAFLLSKTGRKAEAEPIATRAMVYEARYKEMIRENRTDSRLP
jgi:tetratricopeptide (TPR) repeat protein